MTTPAPAHAARRALLTRFGRRAAFATIGVALTGLLALSLLIEHTARPLAIDRAVVRWLFEHVGATVAHGLLTLSEPVLDVVVCVAVAVGAGLRRRWDVVALVAVGPWLAVLMSSIVLKPVIGRTFLPPYTPPVLVAEHSGFAFPSGHETALTGVVTVLVVLMLRSRLAPRTKIVWGVVAFAWVFFGALGLVRNQYHYATDTVGGFCVGVAVVLLVSLAIDALSRRSSPGAPRPLPPASLPQARSRQPVS